MRRKDQHLTGETHARLSSLDGEHKPMRGISNVEEEK
jgi:hypothetical protein